MRVPRPAVTTASMAVVAFTAALALHELAHAAAAASVGGVPRLVSSTDMRADLAGVSPGGYLWIGAAGSLANWALAAVGLLLTRARHFDARVFGWLLAAVNGLIPSVYMVASPLLGFGDWMTSLQRFDGSGLLRILTAVAGVALTVVWTRLSISGLRRLLEGLNAGERLAWAHRLTRVPWWTGGAVAIAAALFSPLGPGRALAIAVGSTLGTTWPLLPIGDAAASPGPGLRAASSEGLAPRVFAIELGPGWWIAGGAATLVFVGLFGPGIRL